MVEPRTVRPATAGPSKRDRVRRQIVQRLASMSPGEALPPERTLAVDLSVARQTVRGAVDELVDGGLLERRPGSGTFVAGPERRLAVSLAMMSFTEDMALRGMVAASRVTSIERRPAGAAVGQHLRISPRAAIWAVRMLRLADREPMAVESMHVPYVVVPDLTRADVEKGSFYDYLAECGVPVDHADQTIDSTVVTQDESALLGVPEHSPAFLFRRTTFSSHGIPVEYVTSVYRGDRYRIRHQLRRRPGTTHRAPPGADS